MIRTLGEAVRLARQSFEAGGLDGADLDARFLVTGLFGLEPSAAVLDRDRPLDAAQWVRVEEAIARRLAREPVYRIIGAREFYGLDFQLSPATLEPRPDTEVLVEAALEFLTAQAKDGSKPRFIDLGTGTGAIALSLLHHCQQATAVMTDIQPAALETALANAAGLGVADRVEARVSDWFSAISERFDLILSNPPYIPDHVVADLEPEVRHHDPMLALVGGADGLDAYRQIASSAANHLAPTGQLMVEIGYDQAESVTELFALSGFERLALLQDLAGRDRVLVFAQPGAPR